MPVKKEKAILLFFLHFFLPLEKFVGSIGNNFISRLSFRNKEPNSHGYFNYDFLTSHASRFIFICITFVYEINTWAGSLPTHIDFGKC